MRQRFEELDSLRGLASLTVLFGHFLLIFPWMEQDTYRSGDGLFVHLFKYSPLHLLWGGHEAVILFFMLSGFVLALPFLGREGKSQPRYGAYLVKRVCRIYVPYLAAVTFAIVMRLLCYRGALDGLGEWANTRWLPSVSWTAVVNHLLFLGDFNSSEFDPILWSLVHEMRISIVFPFVVLLLVRRSTKGSLLVGFVLSVVGFVLMRKTHALYSTNLWITLHYLFMFIIGAVLAKHRETMVAQFQSWKRWVRGGLFVAAILAYTYSWLLYGVGFLHNTLVNDWAIAIGSGLLIWLALASRGMSRFLTGKWVLFLGKISYSLYLYHAVVLLAFLHLLYGKWPVAALLGVAFVVAMGLATLSYHLVESPSMRLGRWLADKVTKRPPVRVTGEKQNPSSL